MDSLFVARLIAVACLFCSWLPTAGAVSCSAFRESICQPYIAAGIWETQVRSYEACGDRGGAACWVRRDEFNGGNWHRALQGCCDRDPCNEQEGHVYGQGITMQDPNSYADTCIQGCQAELNGTNTAACFEGTCYQVVQWQSKGTQCGDDEDQRPTPPEDPDDNEKCEDSPDGELCFDGDQNCYRGASGIELCWTPGEPPFCAQGTSNAACINPKRPDPPRDWEPVSQSNVRNTQTGPTSTVSTTTTTITTYVSISNPPDPPPPDPNEPPPDPNEPKPPDQGAAVINGCSSFTCDAQKVDGGRIMCQQLRVQWEHKCQLDGNTAQASSSCTTPPRCDNIDRAQCAQLHTLWQVSCNKNQAFTDAQCGTTPACSGDPVGCAAARNLHALKCSAQGATNGDAECSTPPVCNGTAPECAQLKQSWALDCASRAQVSGTGSCDAPIQCTGDEASCMALRFQQQIACAESEEGEGEDWSGLFEIGTEGPPDPPEVPESGEDQVTILDGTAFGAVFDAPGFIGGGSCPTFPVVNVMGASVDLNASGAWCTMLALLRVMVLAGATYISARILLGGR